MKSVALQIMYWRIRMTTTKEKIKVMQHFDDGGEVEYKNIDNSWALTNNPSWLWGDASYRVKATSEYIPFTAETFPKGVVWVKGSKWSEGSRVITTVVDIMDIVVGYGMRIDYVKLLTRYQISLDGGITWQKAGELK
jgi:hypothetical protein